MGVLYELCGAMVAEHELQLQLQQAVSVLKRTKDNQTQFYPDRQSQRTDQTYSAHVYQHVVRIRPDGYEADHHSADRHI